MGNNQEISLKFLGIIQEKAQNGPPYFFDLKYVRQNKENYKLM